MFTKFVKNYTTMLKALIFIYMLHFGFVFNESKKCGCSTDRAHNGGIQSKFLEGKQQTDVDSCPKETKDTEQNAGKNSVEMVTIPAGKYQFGTDNIVIPNDIEGPKKIIELKSFLLDKYEVSNRDFLKFVSSTDYKTEAEVFGDSFVFGVFLNDTFKEELVDFRVAQAPWWYKVNNTDWRHPYGPDSNISELMDHPVSHVSWTDARAYCAWRGARLPAEREWEAACRGGARDSDYPWGNELYPNRKHMANIFQGKFPEHNTGKDGYLGTSPVDAFEPNGFGLYNMAGNVWEWTEDNWSKVSDTEKVKKGGSYLCHRSYCFRYRCSARAHNTKDSSAGNLGFRCAKSL